MSRRGMSLLEVLVVVSVFALALGLFFSIERQSRVSTRKSQATDQAYRAAILGLAQLHRELGNARVVTSPAPVAPVLLRYRLPVLQGGRLQTDATGAVVWETDPYTLELDGGKLWRRHPNQGSRLLTDLGQGTASLTVVSGSLVRVTLKAEFDRGDDTRHSESVVSSSFLAQ